MNVPFSFVDRPRPAGGVRCMKRTLIGLALCFAASAHAQPERPASAVETASASLRDIAPSITATGQVQSRSGAEKESSTHFHVFA